MHFKDIVIVSLVIMTKLLFFSLEAKPCGELDKLRRIVLLTRDKDLTSTQRLIHLKKKREEEMRLSTLILEKYQNEELEPTFFQHCLNDEDFQSLKDKISNKIRIGSLNTLAQSQSSHLKNLVQNIHNSNKMMIFQAEFNSLGGEGHKAGFHRTSGAMYYVIGQIPAPEFKLHLIHELLHKYDEEVLFKTSVKFSEEETNLYIYNLAQNYDSFEALNKDDQTLIRNYVGNGLRRGFLAEFKAWATSYRLYRELRKYDEIDRLDWVEDILAQQEEAESYLDFIFRYYAERFSRPDRESLFHWDLLQDSYDVVFEELRGKANKCELMDDLKVFIDECS